MHYFIGLGANVGDRLASLQKAVRRLGLLGHLLARSRVYASSPVGGPPQPPYLNAAVLLESALAPGELLRETQAIEAELGRDRAAEVRFGPRTIDIDLLLAGARGELRHDEAELTLPHPRVGERGFALVTLIDLDPTLVHPVLGRPLAALVAPAQAAGQKWAPTGDSL